MNRRVFGPSVGLVAVLAMALSACGGTDPTAAERSAEPGAAPPAPAGAAGTVAAVSATDIQVQNPRTGQVRVTFTPSTSFTKTVPGTAGDLVVGDCTMATGATNADPTAPLTATSVLISPASADGTCSPSGVGGPRGARRGGGGPDSSAPGGATPSGSPNRPAGAGRGRGGIALGKITSISGAGFVVQLGASDTTRSIAITTTTTITKTVPTDKTGLAVGECVSALGPSDDTGTVEASSISIRQPGPNGCQGGFGGTGRGGPGA